VKLMRPVINPELDELEKKMRRRAGQGRGVRKQEFEKAAELRDEQKQLTEYLKRKRKEWEKAGSFPSSPRKTSLRGFELDRRPAREA